MPLSLQTYAKQQQVDGIDMLEPQFHPFVTADETLSLFNPLSMRSFYFVFDKKVTPSLPVPLVKIFMPLSKY